MDVVIYHNPACGTSRNALALIRAVLSARRSLIPRSIICRTSCRFAGAVTAFFAARP